MEIRVLHRLGCTATPRAIENLRAVLAELDVDVPIEEIILSDDDDLSAWRYFGSPTIQINGMDVDPLTAGLNEYSAGQRVYVSGDQLTAWPDRLMLRQAIQRALPTPA